MDSNVPDDKQVRDTGDGVPSPLLDRVLLAVGGKHSGKNHD